MHNSYTCAFLDLLTTCCTRHVLGVADMFKKPMNEILISGVNALFIAPMKGFGLILALIIIRRVYGHQMLREIRRVRVMCRTKRHF